MVAVRRCVICILRTALASELTVLTSRLARIAESVKTADYTVAATDAAGVASEHVEALAFAWLAREALAGRGGHATLVRAPAALRAAVDPFEPQPPALRGLTQRVKRSFDPEGVLNPGRMYAGI